LFLAIVGVPAWFVYRVLVPAATCSDHIKNGIEEGVDCGVAACGVACAPTISPLTQVAPVIIPTGGTDYDILVHLDNPNQTYGASRVDYLLTVTDTHGLSLGTRNGTTYVNPMQPRYLLFPLMNLTGVPASAQLQFTAADVQWNTLAVQAAGNVQFTVQSDQLTAASHSAQYSAVVVNRSTFTFDSVDVAVLVYNGAGKIVGANTTVLHTLAPSEQRAFTVTWPFGISGAVRAQSVVTTNVFTNANFIKTFGVPEQYQGY
jgi:hypothetical protein